MPVACPTHRALPASISPAWGAMQTTVLHTRVAMKTRTIDIEDVLDTAAPPRFSDTVCWTKLLLHLDGGGDLGHIFHGSQDRVSRFDRRDLPWRFGTGVPFVTGGCSPGGLPAAVRVSVSVPVSVFRGRDRDRVPGRVRAGMRAPRVPSRVPSGSSWRSLREAVPGGWGPGGAAPPSPRSSRPSERSEEAEGSPRRTLGLRPWHSPGAGEIPPLAGCAHPIGLRPRSLRSGPPGRSAWRPRASFRAPVPPVAGPFLGRGLGSWNAKGSAEGKRGCLGGRLGEESRCARFPG